ncbi:hypothetical protein RHMOL_Rhmol01G0137100 [Rhododendron molle]|uniref:Uncharacterized protein n=1 Tax=Rhododendron molle TaxID=49168 RepID=A0ACC0Q2J7_RHOML|nr:hypothetical protein RHMOL_Rhmol01G0137100 [Rhododendron molle]
MLKYYCGQIETENEKLGVQRSSFVTDPGRWHGDTNRSIDLPSHRGSSFRLLRHRNAGSRANCRRRRRGKNQVSPSAAALIILDNFLAYLPSSSNTFGHTISDDNKRPPVSGGGGRRPAGESGSTEE